MSNVAWITGAGKGLGRHVAMQLADKGWRVAASARTASDLDTLKSHCRAMPGEIIPCAADISDESRMAELVGTIERDIGPLDLAVLNAGTYIRFGAEDFTVEKFRDQIDTNVMGTVNCLAPVIEAMKPRRRGRIAIVSSLTAYRGLPMASAYGASKAALTNMGEALRPELEQLGITLSIVHPGFVRTPLTDKNEFPMPFLMEPDIAARRIVKGLERGQFEIAMPRRFAYLLKIGRCLPYGLYFAITRRMIGG